MSYYDYNSYHTASSAELKEKSHRYIEEQKNEGVELDPVFITGKKIVTSWWGEAWCNNLERYADYSNRLARGKRYIKADSVVDLKISKGIINALVTGSRSNPYKVRIHIDELSQEKYERMISRCSSKIENLDTLVKGNFPDDLKELFFDRDGLFPKMSEIHFSCSCPDIADMCKHVAAVLYAIGAKLDNNPLLFFELRGIDSSRLIGNAIDDRIETMLSNAEVKSERIINDEEITNLFGL